jgi:adenylylsulfate kinase
MKKILIFGLPGSGKSYLAEPLAKELGGVWINADQVREQYDDWDFSDEGRMRQALRMKFLSEGVVRAGKFAITDFVCPFEKARVDFAPDYSVWMDTIKEGRFEDTNKMFQAPPTCDYHISKWFDNSHEALLPIINRYMGRDYNGL